MTCPICDNKPTNCDCTDGDRRAFSLQARVDELESRIAELEKTLPPAAPPDADKLIDDLERAAVVQSMRETLDAITKGIVPMRGTPPSQAVIDARAALKARIQPAPPDADTPPLYAWDMCTCGHGQSLHLAHSGECFRAFCQCKQYVSAALKARIQPAPPDSVSDETAANTVICPVCGAQPGEFCMQGEEGGRARRAHARRIKDGRAALKTREVPAPVPATFVPATFVPMDANSTGTPMLRIEAGDAYPLAINGRMWLLIPADRSKP